MSDDPTSTALKPQVSLLWPIFACEEYFFSRKVIARQQCLLPVVSLIPGKGSLALTLHPPRHLAREERQAWVQHGASEMDDLTADILDIVSGLYLRQPDPAAALTVTADDFLRLRGLRQQKSGSGRRGGYQGPWRKKIARHIEILRHIWLKPAWQEALQGPVILAEDPVLEQSRCRPGPYCWNLRPGALFIYNLATQGAGFLSQQVMTYDPYRQKYEKRLARYFAWLAHQGHRSADLTVQQLLTAIDCPIDYSNPSRTRLRLEIALDMLKADTLILHWAYRPEQDPCFHRKRWVPIWLDYAIQIEGLGPF